MAVDRGKPTLVPTSKPKAHWWDQPKPKPAPAPKPKLRKVTSPAPKRTVQPVAQPKPVAPAVAAHGHGGLDRPAPKTIARSPAHTGAKPKPPPKPMLMASRDPKAQALAILATQTNATPETVAKVRKLAAVATAARGGRAPVKTGPAPVAPVKFDDPRVKKLIAGGYLQIAGRQDNPTDFGAAKVLFGPGAKKLVKGAKFQTAKPITQPVVAQGFTPAAAKILSNVGRPYHAVAGAIDAAVQGKNAEKALEAFNKGASGKGKVGGGEILQHAGVHSKFLQGTLGFIIDIGIDPTTGVTFGAGTLAQKAAVQAAEVAGKKALAEGATTEAARAAAQDAARQAATKAGVGEKGLTFHMYGKEVPGVRRGTAAVNKAGKRVLPKTRAEVKSVAREVNPHLAPTGVPISLHQHVENAGAAARSQIHAGEQEAARIAQGIHSKVPEDQYASWLHAIETNDYESLPTKALQDSARRVDEIMMEAHNFARAEGIPIGDVTKAGVRIPELTANPGTTGKALREARARRSVAERANRSQIRKAGVAEGKAKVLAGQSARKRDIKAAESTKPVRTLSKLERERSKLTPAEQEVQNARDAVKHAQTAHEAEVALARMQRSARTVATPKYMRAATRELDQALAARAKAVARQEGPRILKGRTKTDLTKARQDFPSANDLIHATSGESGRPFAAANAPREALGPVDFADQRVARAQAKVDALHAQQAKGFVPHNLTAILEGNAPVAGDVFRTEGVGAKTIKLGTMNKRKDLRTIAAQNAEIPGKFSTNAPLLVANYVASLRTAVAKAKFNKALMATGRPVTYTSKEAVPLAEGESLWAIHGANIHEVKPGETKIPGAHYVALDKNLAEHHIGNVVPMAGRTKAGEYFDHVTGLWKRSKTFSLSFHARNMIGDTNMAYLVPGRSFRRVLIEAGQGGKILRASRRMDKAQRNLEPFAYSGQTVKVGKDRLPVEDLVKRLRAAGAIDTGYISRELRDLRGGSTAERVFSKVPGRGRLKRLMEDRENLHRAGTALHGLGKKMLTDEEAGALSRAYHIDYGNLSKTEKVALRRAMPFYTFTARGLPIFVKALAKSPGKFAAYEKLVEETARATGTDRDKAYAKLQTWEAQQAPLIVGGKQAGASLPVNLFNFLPDPSHLSKSAHLIFDQAMGLVNPLVKTPLEVMSNHSFFTHRPILDPKGNPYAAAPDWVKALPKSVQNKLGVIDNYIDPRSGKKVLGWNPYAAYGVGQAPSLVTQASGLLTQGTGLRGQNLKQKAIADITGVKISPVDKPTNRVLDDLWGKYNRVQYRLNQLRHQYYRGKAVSATNPTAEYTRLLAQSKDLSKKINAASVAAGDKSPSFQSKAKPDPLAKLMQKAGLPAQSGNTQAELDALAKKAGLPAKGGGASKAELDRLAKLAGLP